MMQLMFHEPDQTVLTVDAPQAPEVGEVVKINFEGGKRMISYRVRHRTFWYDQSEDLANVRVGCDLAVDKLYMAQDEDVTSE